MGALTDAFAAPAAPGGPDPRQAALAHYPRYLPQLRIGAVHRGRSIVHRAHDPLSGRTVELGPAAARILAACDGSHTIAQLIEAEAKRSGDPNAAARLVLTCLEIAQGQGLIRPIGTSSAGLVPPHKPGLLFRTLKNPLFARFSLFRPDPLVERLAPLAHLLFTPLGALVWGLILSFGLWLAIGNWSDLFAYGQAHALAPSNLLWTLLLFPLVKILHEAGHALACKRWGGQVRDFGVALLVLIPIPYVDCSDSTFFPRRRQRIIVAGAGMMVEFIVATLALVIWVVATDGFVRQMAFNIVLMSTITTIVFNANPLLRYDAYYILCDLTGLDNLATRAQAIINTMARRLFLGDTRPWPEPSRWRSLLLAFYGVASFIYKTMIVVVVLVSVLPRYFVFGTLLAAWGAMSMVVLPISKQVGAIRDHTRKNGTGWIRLALRFGLILLPLVALLGAPLPYAIVANGSVQVPPQNLVRATGNGFLAALPAGRSAVVDSGMPLVQLQDDILDAEIASRRASLEAQRLRYDTLLASNLAEAALVRSEIDMLAAELKQQEERRARLTLSAARGGDFALTEGLRIGSFVQEGAQLGLIVSPDPERVIVTSLAQEDADLVRRRLTAVSVRTIGSDTTTHEAEMLRSYPLLAAREKGAAPTPTGRFILELSLSDARLLYAQPVALRFDLGSAPLVQQLWHAGSIWISKVMMSRYIEETGQ